MAEVKIELIADPRKGLAGIKRFTKGSASAFDRLKQKGTSAFTKLEAASTRAFVRIRKGLRGMKGELAQGFGSLMPIASVAGVGLLFKGMTDKAQDFQSALEIVRKSCEQMSGREVSGVLKISRARL